MSFVRVEQAVYGSFPFWDRGYAFLATSPGCRAEWLADLRGACERFGQRPRDVGEVEGLFALRLPSGPWAVVGVSGTGRDDQGRPGALAFHALVMSGRDYRAVGSDPFALAAYHRRDWTEAAGPLEPLQVAPTRYGALSTDGDLADRIASAIGRGRRVAVESPGPIEGLARAVWRSLPARVRPRASLATWAFGVGNRFSLVGLPRLGDARAHGYLTPEDLPAPGPSVGRRASWHWRPSALLAASVALAVLAGSWVALGRFERRGEPEPEAASAEPITPWVAPPDRTTYRPEPPDPALRRRVSAGLIDLAERFNAVEPGEFAAGDAEPSAIMRRIADRLRYDGPWLTGEEVRRLRGETAAGRSRALAWDAQVRRFAPDRPLPEGFDRGPLRWQLDALAWSFHLDPEPGRAPAEVPPRLADALAVEALTASNPLADRYPALRDYARFLDELPRR